MKYDGMMQQRLRDRRKMHFARCRVFHAYVFLDPRFRFTRLESAFGG